ncbi:hypothetical protein A4A49_15765 [Nicotiana attenuata]|uniref:Uncharacterized protein n=1 Tax=Nicotiana attenuata TaxID=49451 RepID=A0A314KP78_NICAT|nr:hypothetical protein A4A49_15765 [Nicotiana attenuata]
MNYIVIISQQKPQNSPNLKACSESGFQFLNQWTAIQKPTYTVVHGEIRSAIEIKTLLIYPFIFSVISGKLTSIFLFNLLLLLSKKFVDFMLKIIVAVIVHFNFFFYGEEN